MARGKKPHIDNSYYFCMVKVLRIAVASEDLVYLFAHSLTNDMSSWKSKRRKKSHVQSLGDM